MRMQSDTQTSTGAHGFAAEISQPVEPTVKIGFSFPDGEIMRNLIHE